MNWVVKKLKALAIVNCRTKTKTRTIAFAPRSVVYKLSWSQMKRSTKDQIKTTVKETEPNIFLGTLDIMKLVNMQEQMADE